MTNYPWAFHNPSHGRVAVDNAVDPAKIRKQLETLKREQADAVQASLVTGDVISQDPIYERAVEQPLQNPHVSPALKRKPKNAAKR